MLRTVQSRAFAGASEVLGIDEKEALTTIELTGVNGVLDLESFASWNLTVEEYMIQRATSVGAAGFEGFPYFTADDASFPHNAWIMDMTALIITGAPTAAMVTMGVAASAGTRMVMHWDASVSPGIGGVMFEQNGLPTLPFPYPISKQPAVAIGSPSVPSAAVVNPFNMEIDPAAIGNIVQYTTRIRSAPDGVRVWGTW